jgi:hypothetical protein
MVARRDLTATVFTSNEKLRVRLSVGIELGLWLAAIRQPFPLVTKALDQFL